MNNTSRPMVEVKHFRMDFNQKTVIKDLNFTIQNGETFGLLGSNGSGKTTTIRALLGIYQPTAGQLLIDGQPYEINGKLKLGYLPEERGLYKKEKVIDVMTYFGRLKGMSYDEAETWSLDYLKRVGLDGKQTVRLDKLSGGQQQKIQLGVTIMNDPDLLILDEPTKGFDPVNRRLLIDIIEERKRAGATVVFVSHHMEEVEQLCQRAVLLKDGEVKASGSIDEIKQAHGGKSLDDIFIEIYGGNTSGEVI